MAASYTVTELPGRGRGLVANRDIQAGEIIIAEAPLLLTVAEEAKHTACAHCLRLLPPSTPPPVCAHCQQVAFCSAECAAAAAAKPWVHAPATCAAYARALPAAGADREAAAMLRFLIQALALRAAAAADPRDGRYAALLALAEGAPGTTARAHARAAELRPLLAEAVGDPAGCLGAGADELGALLAREAANAYGIMAPPGKRGARRLRGGGVYAACSAINHECAPNAARFDAFDAAVGAIETAAAAAAGAVNGSGVHNGGGGAAAAAAAAAAAMTATAVLAAAAAGPSGYPANTVVTIRAMHALPAGTEIVQSYFPLNWALGERRAQARRVYGFDCACPRCATEAAPAWAAGAEEDDDGEWETDDGSGGDDDGDDDDDDDMGSSDGEQGGSEEEGDEAAAGGSAGQQQQQQQQQQQKAEPLDPTYLQLFLLKYMCPRRHCYGTMAPTLPGGDALACNVCGGTRTEAEFMAELGH